MGAPSHLAASTSERMIWKSVQKQRILRSANGKCERMSVCMYLCASTSVFQPCMDTVRSQDDIQKDHPSVEPKLGSVGQARRSVRFGLLLDSSLAVAARRTAWFFLGRG